MNRKNSNNRNKKKSKRNSKRKSNQSGGGKAKRAANKYTKNNTSDTIFSKSMTQDELDCILYDNCDRLPYIKTNQNLYWGPSTVSNAGNGVFTDKQFSKNEIVEVAPIIRDSNERWGYNNNIANYTTSCDELNSSLTLGYGSLYNHSNDNNVDYYGSEHGNVFIFVANRNIKKNEELFINYGEDWWTSRQSIGFTNNAD